MARERAAWATCAQEFGILEARRAARIARAGVEVQRSEGERALALIEWESMVRTAPLSDYVDANWCSPYTMSRHQWSYWNAYAPAETLAARYARLREVKFDFARLVEKA